MTEEPLASPEVTFRDLDDIEGIRNGVVAGVTRALESFEPVQYGQHTLELSDVKVGKIPDLSYKAHKKALLAQGSIGAPVYGTWTLKGPDGVVDQRKKLLAYIPVMTKNGTYVRKGIEYTLANQQRMRFGIYTHRKSNDVIESHFNVNPKSGKQFRLQLQPDTGRLFVRAGQANLPIVPILRALGTKEDHIKEMLGDDLYDTNTAKLRADTVAKAIKAFGIKRDPEDKRSDDQLLSETITGFEVDPRAVSHSLIGKPYDKVTPDAILDATRAILALNRNEAEPDNRDSLIYQRVHSHEELFPERIKNDAGRIIRSLVWKLARRGNLDAMPPGIFNKHLDQVLLGSGLGQPPEETNPTEISDQLLRVVRLGEGAIPTVRAVPDEARAVQASYAGWIDPIRSPESAKIGVDNRFTHGVIKGSDGQIYTKMINARTGQVTPVSSDTAGDAIVAFPGEMDDSDDDRALTIVGGRVKRLPKDQVDYVIPHPTQMFTMQTNLMPGVSAVSGGRVFLGAKFVSQALPLVRREAPLVQAQSPVEGTTFEDIIGRKVGTVAASNPGVVTNVTDDEIEVSGPEGAKTYSIANYLPYNRKSFLKHMPKVAIGDKVQAGDLLATSNMTDDKGTLALGTNLNIAYVPFSRGGGNNYEDAIVLSESGAKKLVAEQMYTKKLDKHDGTPDKSKYRSIFPGTFNKAQLDTIGDDGLVKPGTTVNFGDPLILSAVQRPHKKPGMGGLKSGRRYADASVTWDHEAPGYITDSAIGSQGALIATRVENPVNVGDKMCYSSDTEVMTRDGWVPIPGLTKNHDIASRSPSGEIEYLKADVINVYPHNGKMYSLSTTQVDLLVTPNHKLWAQPRGKSEYGLYEAEELFGRRYRSDTTGEWKGVSPENIVIPGPTVACGQGGAGQRTLPDLVLPVRAYLMLLGMYLSEGSVVNTKRKDVHTGYTRRVDVHQQKAAFVERARLALEELKGTGITATYNEKAKRFIINDARLSVYFSQFGHSHSKFIPREVFDYSREDLLVLYEWMMWGDGHRGPVMDSYCTVSEQLANDFQQLVFHLGWASTIKSRPACSGTILGRSYEFRKRFDVFVRKAKTKPTINHGHIKTQNGQTEKWSDYNGFVYCPTLPRNHVLYVRRNGKPVWSGNSGRYGDKHIISAIVPDAQMPTDEEGNTLDAMVNPLGIISRGNPAQLVEAALGRVAKMQGTRQALAAFTKGDMSQEALETLRKYGLKSTQDLYDPVLGRKIKNISTGNRFYMRLHHLAEGKISGRSASGSYTQEGVPAKGGGESAPRIGLMEVNALLSAGALNVLDDSHRVRSSKNEDYWRAVRLGFAPPPPKSPELIGKFLGLLTAAGVHVNQEGSKLNIMAMTDPQVDEVAKGEITRGETVKFPSLDPIKGGLFDRGITGGHGGNRFGKIEFGMKIPNPVMEQPIRRILDLTEGQMRDILSYKEQLNGKRGPDAIQHALQRINVPQEIEAARQKVKTSKRTPRDAAIKKLRVLEMFERTGLKPGDMMISKLPVLPPTFRPISLMSNDVPLVNSVNLLYKDLLQAKDSYHALTKELDKENTGDELLAVYDAAKAVVGLGDPINKETQSRHARGLLQVVFGDSPKMGQFQRKLMSKTVNLGGRAVITPDPRLNMDQMGLPEEIAWKSYAPFIMRRLVRRGVKPIVALNMVKNREPQALTELNKEMQVRPVLINRAPSLHRYSIMGSWPVLTKSRSMHLSPVVTPAFNADFDGDESLNKVFLVINSENFSLLNADMWYDKCKEIDMSYFKTRVAGISKDDRIMLVDLADFPHDDQHVTQRHIDFHTVPDGLRVIAMDESTGRLTAAEVSHWSLHRQREIEIVTLSSKKQIITDDDERAVYGVDIDTLQWCRRTPSNSARLAVPVADLDESLPQTTSRIRLDQKSNVSQGIGWLPHVLKDSVETSYSLGHWIGCMVGDGWVSCHNDNPQRVSFACSKPELAKVVTEESQQFFVDPINVGCVDPGMGGEFKNSGGCDCYNICSKRLSAILLNWIGKTAQKKHLPIFTWTAPREFKLGLIAGLMDTDGSVSQSNAKSKPQWLINFSTTSIRLVQEFQHLLRTLGVSSAITGSKTPKGEPCWVLNISTPDAYRELYDLKLAIPEKQQRFIEFFEGPEPDRLGAYSRFRLMPMPKWLADELTRVILNKDNHNLYTAIKMAGGKGHISKELARCVLKYMDDHDLTCSHPAFQTWRSLVKQDSFHFERVTNVEKTGIKEDGYDLTVPGYETFMSIDGIVLSNTMAVHVPATDAAVKEISEKLMPSQQLIHVRDFKSHFHPRQEYQLGLYEATEHSKKKTSKIYTSIKDAVAAFRRGELDLRDIIEIAGMKTQPSTLTELKGLLS